MPVQVQFESDLAEGRYTGSEPIQALLIPARVASSMCGKSLRTWRAWDSAGLIPRPIRIGRSTLWRTEELQAWVDAGCPRRAAWESRL
jgi:predicted DNA-binding transcriptional regulator AlpA